MRYVTWSVVLLSLTLSPISVKADETPEVMLVPKIEYCNLIISNHSLTPLGNIAEYNKARNECYEMMTVPKSYFCPFVLNSLDAHINSLRCEGGLDYMTQSLEECFAGTINNLNGTYFDICFPLCAKKQKSVKDRHEKYIDLMLDNPDDNTLKKAFQDFHQALIDLRKCIHP